MSGGKWGYKGYEIAEDAPRMFAFLEAIAKTEHIVDWWASGDSDDESAGKRLLALWRDVFDHVYG